MKSGKGSWDQKAWNCWAGLPFPRSATLWWFPQASMGLILIPMPTSCPKAQALRQSFLNLNLQKSSSNYLTLSWLPTWTLVSPLTIYLTGLLEDSMKCSSRKGCEQGRKRVLGNWQPARITLLPKMSMVRHVSRASTGQKQCSQSYIPPLPNEHRARPVAN